MNLTGDIIKLNLCNKIKYHYEFRKVCNFITNSNTIKALSIGYNQLSCHDCIHLAEAMRHNKSLQILHINNNGIGNKGCVYLAEVIRDNKSLQELCLDANNIGEKGIKALGDAIQYNKTLQILTVDGNNGIRRGIKYFWDKIMHGNNRLQVVYLGHGVSDLVFFHKYYVSCYYHLVVDKQKWFIQNFKHRNNKFKLLLFLKN